MGGSWLEVCVTHHPGHTIIFVGCGDYYLRFGLHADSIVLVDFLHVLGSIERGFISSPNAFKQTLGLFCRNYSLLSFLPSWSQEVDTSWDVLLMINVMSKFQSCSSIAE